MPAQSREFAAQQCPGVRVITLGRFRVEVENDPLQFGRKPQRKPIDLLKLLIAYGGEAVSAEQLAEDLWPDSEGDVALAALRTTLSRLRKLIGPGAVLGDIRGLTLNPKVCSIDALTFERLLAKSKCADPVGCGDKARTALDEALSLYGGAFLPGEFMLPPVVSARARLHSVFVRALVELGQRYELAGLTARAMDLYRRGLEIDGCAEEVARRLMQVCRGSGRAAEGVAAYRRCEAALQAQLGVQPSAATQSALRDLLALTERDAADHRRDASAIVAPVFGAGPADLSIAIRPFGDLSPQGDHQRLADAIRETTISLLGTLPQLSLVTRPSSAVRYLLQGSVMVVANCLRATVHLIDARTGQHAWSEQLDYSLHDVNKARDQVAIQVARGLTAKLIFGECATLLLSPNIHVWKALTLVGVLLHRQHRQDHLRARALVSRILEVEQQEPLILALHATMHIVEHWKRWTVDPARSLRIGEQMLRQLKKKYAFDGLGVQSLAWACALRGDFDEALHHASKGVDRTPENFSSHTFLAIPLLYQGRHAEALDKLNDAVGVCPQPPHWIYKDRAVAQFCLGRYDEAANGLATVLADKYSLHRHANLLDTHMIYVASLAAAGRAEQARHEARATVASHPSASAGHWCRWQFQPYKDKDPALRMERLLVAAGLPQ